VDRKIPRGARFERLGILSSEKAGRELLYLNEALLDILAR